MAGIQCRGHLHHDGSNLPYRRFNCSGFALGQTGRLTGARMYRHYRSERKHVKCSADHGIAALAMGRLNWTDVALLSDPEGGRTYRSACVSFLAAECPIRR